MTGVEWTARLLLRGRGYLTLAATWNAEGDVMLLSARDEDGRERLADLTPPEWHAATCAAADAQPAGGLRQHLYEVAMERRLDLRREQG